MKIVVISDTHNRKIEVPEGDLLIHCGDATGRGSEDEMIEFNDWIKTLPHKQKIYVPGNHDKLGERDEKLFRKLLPSMTVLINQEIIIEGIKIYGSPYTPTFFKWAFMKDRGPDMKKNWDLIPLDTDILVTHGPPHGFLDIADEWVTFDHTFKHLPEDQWVPRKVRTQVHVGCEELYQAVLRVKPKYHLFGHIHGGYGRVNMGETTLINAAICTEAYEPDNSPVVINYSKKK